MAFTQAAVQGVIVEVPTYNATIGSPPVLTSASAYMGLLVELRVLNNLLNAQFQNIDLNQMRADELNAIVPPGAQ